MSNGKLISPNLDDRTWQDIMDEARALIPKYAPEWTDHNPSDLGIILIELFAWLIEGMIYRLNRVPEKNFIEFLNLLGITRDPATPAQTYVTFTVTEQELLIPKGTQISTLQTEVAEAIVFETDEDLTASPINLLNCLTVSSIGRIGKFYLYKNKTKPLVLGPLQDTEFSITPSATKTIYLGFDELPKNPLHISFYFKEGTPKDSTELTYFYYRQGVGWDEMEAGSVVDGTDLFNKSGKMVINIPSAWQASKPGEWTGNHWVKPGRGEEEVEDSRYWIAIQVGNLLEYSLNFILKGIAINSVSVTNALTVNIDHSISDAQAELPGISNGRQFQVFNLKNTPLYKQPKVTDPYQHLIIQVREPDADGTFEDWARVEDIPKGEGKYYRCNPVSGEIIFGNYHLTEEGEEEGNGKIPPNGSEIRALTYRYVIGGKKGNVPAHTVNILRSAIQGIIGVNNPGAASGGSDQESIEETRRRGPEALKNRFRAVTIEDYEYLAKEASTDVQIVRALPPKLITDPSKKKEFAQPWNYGSLPRDTSFVNVIIIPEAPIDNRIPMPSEELLDEVQQYLDERRTVATRLMVTHPRYLPIIVKGKIFIWEQAEKDGLVDLNDFKDDVIAKIMQFLHPVWGGLDKKGWEVGQDITIPGLFDFIKPETHIGYISELRIQADNPEYDPPERPDELQASDVWVQLADYEIICSAQKDQHEKELIIDIKE